MNIVLKSNELKKYFGNNDILTDNQANQIFNKLEIDLTSQKISEELISDLNEIARQHPTLLRHIVVKNSGQAPVNMQKLVDTIARLTEPLSRGTNKGVYDLKIVSRFKDDLELDFSRIRNANEINLVNNDYSNLAEAGKIKFDTSLKGLRLNGFDLSTLDLTGKGLETLNLDGSGNRNFSQIKGKENLKRVGVSNRGFDREVTDIVDFVNASKKVHTFTMYKIPSKDLKLLRIINNPNLTTLSITSCGLEDLDGLETWHDKLGFLGLYGNNISEKDLARINDFRKNNPRTEINIRENNQIKALLASKSAESFSSITYKNILDAQTIELEQSGKQITKDNALQYLLDNELIQYSIRDAKRVREAGITLNPIELENDSDLDTIDFSADYLKGSNLLLSVKQIDKLIKSGKNIPLDISIKIESAADLSAEKIKEIYSKLKIKDVRMVGPDLNKQQRTPYTPIQYLRARMLLDEVVSGIDKNETDLDKFTTIYSRLANSMAYDYRSIKRDTTEEIRYSNEVVSQSRNLVGGLSTGKCVCAGYAETLRNALALVGIRSRYITGKCYKDPDYTSRHAWNHVEIKEPTGEKAWYYADLTWDEQISKPQAQKGRYRYVLLNEDKFERHEVTYTRGMKPTSKEAYDMFTLIPSMERAKQRLIDPRESLKAKLEREKQAKDAEKKKEEARIAELEKKRQEEAKKKENGKQEENKKEPLDPSKVSIDGLNDLVEKRNEYVNKINEISDLLDSAKGLTSDKIREYQEKMKFAEEEYFKQVDKIEEYKKVLAEKEQKELDKKKEELENLERQAEEEKKVPGKKYVIIEKSKDEQIEELEEKIANREAVLIAYGDRAHENRYIELKEWKEKLENLRNQDFGENVVTRKELEELKNKIANREAMIAARGSSLNEEKFNELNEWKEKLKEIEEGKSQDKQGTVSQELLDKIEKTKEIIREKQENLKLINEPQTVLIRTPKMMAMPTSEEIKVVKFEEPQKPDPKRDSKDRLVYEKTKYISIKTKEEMIKNIKEERADRIEDAIANFTNKLFKRDENGVSEGLRFVIELGVAAYTGISDAIYKLKNKGKDRYDEQFEELIKSQKTVFGKESPLDNYKIEKKELNKSEMENTAKQANSNEKGDERE